MAELSLTIPAGGRLAIVGKTGTGKSYLARAMFLATRGRRVVVDPHDSKETSGDWPTTHLSKVDWSKGDTWRVVPKDPLDQKYYDTLYQSFFEQGNMLIWSDEANAITTSHTIPLGVRMVLFQGRKRRISHIAASPRPVGVHPGIWAQSELWAIFRLPWGSDRDTVAASAGMPKDQFEALQSQLTRYGFIWWDQNKDQLVVVEKGLGPNVITALEASMGSKEPAA